VQNPRLLALRLARNLIMDLGLATDEKV
jgi:hypothetical protein